MHTTLDPETQKLVDERNALLQEKEKGADIRDQLHKINAKLDSLGLAYQSRDPNYDDYLRTIHELRTERQKPYTPEQIEEQNKFIRSFLEKMQ